jgi:hypothetical protein
MPQPESYSSGLSANLDSEIGKAIVDLGLATKTEVDFCKEQQKQSSDPNQRSLADVLIEHNFITVNQAKRIRTKLEEAAQPDSRLSPDGKMRQGGDGHGL